MPLAVLLLCLSVLAGAVGCGASHDEEPTARQTSALTATWGSGADGGAVERWDGLAPVTDKTSYALGEPVVVSWVDGSAGDMIAIGPAGATPWTGTQSVSIGPGSGSHAFTGLPVGLYEARYYDASNLLRSTSVPFEVACNGSQALPALVHVDAGYSSTCAVGLDNRVRCWGDNSYGQLGDGTTNHSLVPLEVWWFRNVLDVDTGGYHSCGLLNDHTVWCWGANSYGQLGDGSKVDNHIPVAVQGLSSAEAIATGYYHSCALLSDHTMRCWGNNWYGQLGDGSTTHRSGPVTVQGLSNVVASSTGVFHSCALLSDHTIRCWGLNNESQLGDGSRAQRNYPVAVRGISDAVAVSAGPYHSCALLSDRSVRCWGHNDFGQLGDGTNSFRLSPVVVQGISDAVAISVGGYHSCALLSDDTIQCWGANWYGQLGDGTMDDQHYPAAVQGLTSASALSAGLLHSCALLSNGRIKCWGTNESGQLGNGATLDSSTPSLTLSFSCPDVGTHYATPYVQDWESGAAGWADGSGQPPTLTTDASSPSGETVQQLTRSTTAGDYFSPSIGITSGEQYCLRARVKWLGGAAPFLGVQMSSNSGTNLVWLIGTAYTDQWGPVAVVDAANSGWQALSRAFIAPTGTTKVRLTDRLSTTGSKGGADESYLDGISLTVCHGSLSTDKSRYVEGEAVNVTWVDAAPGGSIGIARVGSATLAASTPIGTGAGSTEFSGLSAGTYEARYFGSSNRLLATSVPFEVRCGNARDLPGFISVSAGYYCTCAVDSDHWMRCWGDNTSGRIGAGNTKGLVVPAEFWGLRNVSTSESDYDHACALTDDHKIWCWGNNWYGQLGNGSRDGAGPVPVQGVSSAVSIGVGSTYSCAMLSDFTVRCWGANWGGQIGDGTTTDRTIPVTVVGISDATAISVGGYHSCALLRDNTIRCWGNNWKGLLGDGTTSTSTTPVAAFGINQAVAISVGGYHSCTLLNDNTIRCWGYNEYSQLGDGTTQSWSSMPVVVKGISNAVAISAGEYHACALLSDHTIRCWGRNDQGQLGDGTTINRSSPVTVQGIIDATAVSAGDQHSCALLSNGRIICWGNNNYGQLGNGTLSTSTTPVPVASFTCDSGVTVSVGKNRYYSTESVVVDWSGSRSPNDRIAIAPVGSPLSTVTASISTGNNSGSYAFGGIPAGDYEARFFDYASNLVATSPAFEVIEVSTSLEKQSYNLGDPVSVSWNSSEVLDGLLAIAPYGSDISTITASTEIRSATGTHSFEGLTVGAYEVRVFDEGGQLVNTGTSFVVTAPVTIAVEKAQYFAGQNIRVHWTGYQSRNDWIALAYASSWPGDDFAYGGTNGAGAGTLDFGGLWEETFVARYYDENGQLVTTSAPFTVVAAPTLTTSKPAYLLGDIVQASWTAPMAMEGQVVVAPADSPPDSVTASIAVSGESTGSHSVPNLQTGDYELRFFDSTSVWLSTSPGFRVTPVVLANDKAGYGVGDPIVVTWRNTLEPGGTLVIAPAGSDASTITASTTIGVGSGTYAFPAVPVGDYEVRFLDSSSNVVATTGTFSVYERLRASKTSYAPSDFIVVEWRDCPNDPNKRIVIAPDGSSDQTVTDEVLASSVDGAHAFGPLQRGTYRARYFNASNGNKLHESGAISVGTSPATFVQFGPGDYHSCGISSQHSILCWGANWSGQLGDGTYIDKTSAVKVVGLNNAVAITSGAASNCAIMMDGTLKCWGENGCGQLGDDTNTVSAVPVQVVGIANATKVAAAAHHSCAVRGDGTVKCWGCGWNGELGDGTTSDSRIPVDVVGITNAIDISANIEADSHTCALLADGKVRCWGHNGYGQLGCGTQSNSSVPVEVEGITNAIGVGVANGVTCAVLSSGQVKCWGYNGYGQLGDGTMIDSATPVDVLGIDSAVSVTSGAYHSCARLSDGTARCWGYNGFGQLGDGNVAYPGSSVPVQVSGLVGSASVRAGGYHTCALLGNGNLKCWGNNSNGQLGDGSGLNSAQTEGFANVRNMSAGNTESCVSTIDGHVRCWGANSFGELGDGTIINRYTPVQVSGISTAIDVSTGENYACSTLSNGHVACWGSNYNGELGGGSGEYYSALPVEIPGITTANAAVSKFYHSCAILSDGRLSCWGANWSGQLGTDLDATLATVKGVGTGMDFTCALEFSGRVLCWGANGNGQLGNGTNNDSATPVEVSGLDDAIAVVSSGWHSCAILGDGTILCWGNNDYGQLGDSTTAYRNVPVAVYGIDNAVAIDAGDFHTCALLADGRVKCWGYNENAQLGDGTVIDRYFPIELGGIANAQAIMVGHMHTCVLHSGDKLRCWGYGADGELGDGPQLLSVSPVTVMQQD